MEFIPSDEQQLWLIDSLADLLRVRGTGHFLSMPLVEPTWTFFPDRWSFSDLGLDRVVRRLMQYAGLGRLDVRIVDFIQPRITERSKRRIHHSLAGAFLGIQDDSCYFAFNVDAPAEEEYIAGVMAHEVAHAYRVHHGICDDSDPDREEWLTDVTAVYLGFGILVANNSYRYRKTSSGIVGFGTFFSQSEDRAGYLTPQAFSFLLAIQIQARALDRARRNRVLKHLETTQRAFVKAAADVIALWPDEIFDRLQFPRQGESVPEVPLRSVLLPLPEPDVADDEVREKEVGEVGTGSPFLFNTGRPVFRVRQTRTIQYGTFGAAGGLAVVALAMIVSIRGWPLAAVPLIGLGAGIAAGRRRRFDLCSDPECQSILASGATTCPNCGGLIVGSIRHASARLEAEEEFERTHVTPRRKKSRPRRKRHPGR